jgi:hypothetical protein
MRCAAASLVLWIPIALLPNKLVFQQKVVVGELCTAPFARVADFSVCVCMTQDLGRGLQQLLDFDGDVESVYARHFVVCFFIHKQAALSAYNKAGVHSGDHAV